MAKIVSNYDYITSSQKSIIESNIPEKLSVIQDNLLDFEISFQSFDWARDEMVKISKELVSMGRYFAAQHKLDESHTLINGIKSEVTNNYGIKFYNDARNSRGQFYAGHHEYGFHARDGSFVEARPFMRPALYAVSRASQGEFATILEELLRGTFTEGGYQGISNLSFGKELGKYRNFSSLNTTLTNMMSSSTVNPRNFTIENLEKQTRTPWSVRRTVFSDKKNTLHKQDVGWREIKESVRSGRSINRSKLASIKYALAHGQKTKTKTKIIRQKSVSVGRTIYNPANKVQGLRQGKALQKQQMDKMWKEHDDKITREHKEYDLNKGNKKGSSIKPKTMYDSPIEPWRSYDKKSVSNLRPKLSEAQPNTYKINHNKKGNYKSSLVSEKVRKTKGYQKKYGTGKSTKKQQSSNNKINEKKQVVYIQYDKNMYEQLPNVRGMKKTIRPSELESDFTKVYTEEGKEFYIPKEWGKKSR